MQFSSEFSCSGRVWTEFRMKFFFLFFGLSDPIFARNNAGKRFSNFLNFCAIFFGIFLPRSSMNGILDQNFFSLFHGLSHPVWDKNNAEKRFFNFYNFFAIFFGIFLPGSSTNGIWDWNFFLPFSAYLFLLWLKIMPERGFLEFLNFFCNFLTGVQYKRNSGLKFFSPFLDLSHPVLARNIAWNRFFNFLNFFLFFS